ncbi:MAG: hypothetical protein PHT94_00795 [Candidatus Nanoarchaeia archaeon]|nr:hypothetical protein [Candidatus Nanoarchaeia archaeon]
MHNKENYVRTFKRKIPTIEAIKWTGENLEEVKEFLGKSFIETIVLEKLGDKTLIHYFNKTQKCTAAPNSYIFLDEVGFFNHLYEDKFLEIYEEYHGMEMPTCY